jgi:uncharacterized protein (DUF2249 family)
MTTENLIGADKVMDVREIPCATKHPLLVKTFMELPAGDHFILLNGHEPVRLRDQFAAQWPDTFTWESLPAAPGEFRIKVTKLKPLGEPATPVATTCGGH